MRVFDVYDEDSFIWDSRSGSYWSSDVGSTAGGDPNALAIGSVDGHEVNDAFAVTTREIFHLQVHAKMELDMQDNGVADTMSEVHILDRDAQPDEAPMAAGSSAANTLPAIGSDVRNEHTRLPETPEERIDRLLAVRRTDPK